MNTAYILRNFCVALFGLLFSTLVLAHGGAAGTDTDQCKFELEPGHWIHYTAYQPSAYPAEEFCGSLPGTTTRTQLVFDYQDPRYRDMTVEFEVTKEPEGTRVFFLPGSKHKSGTVNLDLPNGVPDAGQYLIHITLVPDQGERLDAHMAFKAGTGAPVTKTNFFIYIFFALVGLYALYLFVPGFKNVVDGMLGKNKEEA